jgi:hypothetical protein
MMEDRQWREWTTDFKAGGRSLQTSDLARRLRRSSIEMAGEVGLTIAVCLGVVLLLAHRMLNKPHPVIVSISAVVIAFLAVSVVILFRLRRGSWRSAEQTPRALVALLRRREESRLREARFSMKSSIALGLAVTLWIPWRLWVDWDGYVREPWRAVLGVGGTYALLAVALLVTWRWRIRKEGALKVALEMERSFEDNEKEGGTT